MAIISMATMLPATASDNSDAPCCVPLERWDTEQYSSTSGKEAGRLEARFGAFVIGAEMFDAAAFNVSRYAALQVTQTSRLPRVVPLPKSIPCFRSSSSC